MQKKKRYIKNSAAIRKVLIQPQMFLHNAKTYMNNNRENQSKKTKK